MHKEGIVPFIKALVHKQDYLLIDDSAFQFSGNEKTMLSQKICKRKRGVGGTGVVFYKKVKDHWLAEYYNNQGLPEQSVSALLCLARYLFDGGNFGSESFQIFHNGSDFKLTYLEAETFMIGMGDPVFGQMPLKEAQKTDLGLISISTPSSRIAAYEVTIGKPYLVFLPAIQQKGWKQELIEHIGQTEWKNHILLEARGLSPEEFQYKPLVKIPNRDYIEETAAGGAVLTAAGICDNELVVKKGTRDFFFSWKQRLHVAAMVEYSFSGDFSFYRIQEEG